MISCCEVPTDRPERYGKQLVSHMSRKVPGTFDVQARQGSITFPKEPVHAAKQHTDAAPVQDLPPEQIGGILQISWEDHGKVLHLRLEGEDQHVRRLQGVVDRHLARFMSCPDSSFTWH